MPEHKVYLAILFAKIRVLLVKSDVQTIKKVPIRFQQARFQMLGSHLPTGGLRLELL